MVIAHACVCSFEIERVAHAGPLPPPPAPALCCCGILVSSNFPLSTWHKSGAPPLQWSLLFNACSGGSDPPFSISSLIYTLHFGCLEAQPPNGSPQERRCPCGPDSLYAWPLLRRQDRPCVCSACSVRRGGRAGGRVRRRWQRHAGAMAWWGHGLGCEAHTPVAALGSPGCRVWIGRVRGCVEQPGFGSAGGPGPAAASTVAARFPRRWGPPWGSRQPGPPQRLAVTRWTRGPEARLCPRLCLAHHFCVFEDSVHGVSRTAGLGFATCSPGFLGCPA